MTLREIINNFEGSKYWTSGKIFICYSVDRMKRLKALNGGIGPDGELKSISELSEDELNMEVKANQVWIEDGDLCIDPYKNW